MEQAKPFIKWAGGKRNLIPQLKSFYPYELQSRKIKKYVEPFVGGGAVLIDMLQKYNIKEVYAFDINMDLINCYCVIKEKVNQLIDELVIKEKVFLDSVDQDRQKYYYDIRKEYNSYKIQPNELSVKRATEFIFLNKTCFNGLYRVNRKGEFNVPCGKYKHPTICDEANLRNLSNLFRNVIFKYGDYKESEKYIDINTFVYFDPPYRPLSVTSSFTSYTTEEFDDEKQRELAKYFKKLNEKEAKLMLSNSNPKNINRDDNFFEDIYKGFNINEISAKRMINCNGTKRGEISELLIINYNS